MTLEDESIFSELVRATCAIILQKLSCVVDVARTQAASDVIDVLRLSSDAPTKDSHASPNQLASVVSHRSESRSPAM